MRSNKIKTSMMISVHNFVLIAKKNRKLTDTAAAA